LGPVGICPDLSSLRHSRRRQARRASPCRHASLHDAKAPRSSDAAGVDRTSTAPRRATAIWTRATRIMLGKVDGEVSCSGLNVFYDSRRSRARKKGRPFSGTKGTRKLPSETNSEHIDAELARNVIHPD
jgi:hypothetical protein